MRIKHIGFSRAIDSVPISPIASTATHGFAFRRTVPVMFKPLARTVIIPLHDAPMVCTEEFLSRYAGHAVTSAFHISTNEVA